MQAQSTAVPTLVTGDAASLLTMPGITSPGREQILVAPRHLTNLVGRQIRGLWFRRDTGVDASSAALLGGGSTVTVHLSTSPRSANSPSQQLGLNVGPDVQTVFSGTVTFPNAPAVQVGASVPWDAVHAVRIGFTTPFVYNGGTLCIDIDGIPGPQSEHWWPIDAVSDPVRGSATKVGEACGPQAAPNAPTATVATGTLVPGGSALFRSRGTPGSSSVCAIAVAAAANTLPLSVIGADPRCHVHVVGILGVQTAVHGASFMPSQGAFPGGWATTLVPLPRVPSFFDARFATQWFSLTVPITASNAVDCTVASRVSPLGMAIVVHSSGGPAGVGRVITQRAPVMQLEY